MDGSGVPPLTAGVVGEAPILVNRPGAKARRPTAKHALWALMAVCGVSVLFSTEIPILTARTGDDHDTYLGLVTDRYLFVPHLIGGLLATFIGPIQFSSRVRRARARLHRVLGRVYVGSIVVGAITAVVIDWGRPLFVAVAVQASAWLVCTLFGLMTARNRHFVEHRRWMIRSYAMTFTFIATRVLNFWPPYANMSAATFTLVDIGMTFVAVSGPTVTFDWKVLTRNADRNGRDARFTDPAGKESSERDDPRNCRGSASRTGR